MRSVTASSAGAQSRRTSFELYVFRRGQWMVEAVFDDRHHAIEEAKSFLERARGLAAARVVAVDPNGDEFRESMVFYGSSGLARAIAAARPLPDPAAAAPEGAPFAVLALARSSRPVLLLLALIALTVAFGVVDYRNAQRHPWVFDTPAARLPHEVSMPWR
jgi:hypothetical protein